MRDGRLLSFSSCPYRPINDTPAGAVKQFIVYFATQDTAALARLLTADYRLFPTDPGVAARFHSGLDRGAQIDSVTRHPAITGDQDPSGGATGFSVLGEFTDSIAAQAPAPHSRARQSVALQAFRVDTLTDGEHPPLVGPVPVIFVVVRGDSAAMAPGVAVDPRRWYVARWYAGPGLGGGEIAIEGVERGAVPAARVVVPHALEVRRLSALHEWPLTFEITWSGAGPARADLFDVAGRKVMTRSLARMAAGVHTFHLERGEFPAGLYWLRVRHGDERAATKFVVLP